MGKKSTKINKNIYFQCREEAGLTRAEASDLMPGYTENKIEKIENERTLIAPEDVVAMAKAYKRPELCNYYCSNECAIGENTTPEIKIESLQAIVLGLLASMNKLEKQKDVLINITADGKISDDEITDYISIQDTLDKMYISIGSLKLWLKQKMANNDINEDLIMEAIASLKE